MQDFNFSIEPQNQLSEQQKNYLLATYIVYTIGLFSVGVVSIIGVVMAYLKRDDYNATIYGGHMTYLIRTFWIGLLYMIISFLLMLVGIGFLLWILTGIWYIIRVIKGFVLFFDKKPHPKPDTWWF